MDVSRISFSLTKILLLYLLSIYFGLCESQEDRGVRIVDGTSPRDGRVEIYVNDKWGTVSTDGWTNKEAAVVCSQLGFQGPAVSKKLGKAELAIDVPVYSVACSKGSGPLADCDIQKTNPEVMQGASFDYLDGLEYYNHDQNAGVTCEDVGNGNNVATIVMINVIGLIAIGVIVLCSYLTYRLISRRSAAKEGKAEGKPESIAMYSTRIRKDYADTQEDPRNIQEDRADQAQPLIPPTHLHSRKIKSDCADVSEDRGKIQEDRAEQNEAVNAPDVESEIV